MDQDEEFELISPIPLPELPNHDNKEQGIGNGDGHESQRLGPIPEASAIMGRITARISQPELMDTFDQHTNLDQMLLYMNCFRDCETREDVMELLDYLDPVLETGFTGLSIIAGVGDIVFDWIGIVNSFMVGGVAFNFLCAVFIYFLSMFIGLLRISFIGKEAYNLRKVMILGLSPPNAQRIEVEPYKYQSILEFWNGDWLNAGRIIWKATCKHYTSLCDTFSSALNFMALRVFRRPSAACPNGLLIYEATIMTPSSSFSLGESQTTDHAREGSEELDSLLKIIDEESVPSFSRLWSLFHASSLPLNSLVVSKTRELYDRCRHDPAWASKDLTIYVQATFLHFLRFQSAEMTKTELFVETIPQLILRTTYLVERLVTQGLIVAVLESGWMERLAVPFSFLFPPLQVVLSTFKKQEYYFAVYRLGQNFETRASEEDEARQAGQRIMPPLSLPYKGFCVLAHVLTMGPLVFVGALLLSSTIGFGPLILVVLLLTFYVFWRAAVVHTWYYTWTYTLFTPQFDRDEFRQQMTKNNLLGKCAIFVVGNLVILASLNLDTDAMLCGNLPPKFLSLAEFHGILTAIYLTGSLLHWLKREWFRRSLGVNYERYVGAHDN